MTLPVAILAGGLATRLRPLTEQVPKALIEVAGEPFAFHQLRQLAKQNVGHVVFCVGYLGEQIVDAVGDGSRFGLKIDYAFDGPTLLGTGGAIAKAQPLLGEAFFVLYGDAYLVIDYGAVEQAFRASGCPALMTVFRNEGRWDSSNVEFAEGRILAYSKTSKTARMQYIDYGLGILTRAALVRPEAGLAFDLAVLYEDLARRGKLAAFEAHHRFYEIGSLAGIEDMAGFLNRGTGK